MFALGNSEEYALEIKQCDGCGAEIDLDDDRMYQEFEGQYYCGDCRTNKKRKAYFFLKTDTGELEYCVLIMDFDDRLYQIQYIPADNDRFLNRSDWVKQCMEGIR